MRELCDICHTEKTGVYLECVDCRQDNKNRHRNALELALKERDEARAKLGVVSLEKNILEKELQELRKGAKL